jgi:hypothetical protein
MDKEEAKVCCGFCFYLAGSVTNREHTFFCWELGHDIPKEKLYKKVECKTFMFMEEVK